jgi:hypothetical protein
MVAARSCVDCRNPTNLNPYLEHEALKPSITRIAVLQTRQNIQSDALVYMIKLGTNWLVAT